VQNPIPSWPTLHPGDDPQTGYALLFSVHKNGLGAQRKVLENVRFEATRILTDNQIWKMLSAFVAHFAPIASQITRLPRVFLGLIEWKEEHKVLLYRSTFTNDEVIALCKR
jgi:hypothetical protein